MSAQMQFTIGDAEVPWWKQLWNKVSWSKCNFFMWLVAHNRCLTWDNLCKRGFQGPSYYVLCGHGEESISHLFFNCSYSLQLWHLWWSAWGCSCRHASSLPEFWAGLGSAPSKSSSLHAAWIAGPSFMLWHIWLERNRRIFQGVRVGVLHLWWKILHSLQETIHVKCELDGGMDLVDLAICNRLNFPLQDGAVAPRFPSVSRNLQHQRKGQVNRDGHWTPPPFGVLKINIDGSSRGNPGPAGIGGVVRCSSGDVKFFFSVHKSYYTNNLMEAQAILYAVEQCCLRGWSKVICESDSQVVVNLLSSQDLDDVSWQLATVVNQIMLFSTSFELIRFTYIPREWNRAADCLAKWASNHDPGWNIMDRRQLSAEMAQEFDDLIVQDQAPC